MPNSVCSVCGVCDVSGHSGLGPDWRQCQWNVNGRINGMANNKQFVYDVLIFDDDAFVCSLSQ